MSDRIGNKGPLSAGGTGAVEMGGTASASVGEIDEVPTPAIDGTDGTGGMMMMKISRC